MYSRALESFPVRIVGWRRNIACVCNGTLERLLNIDEIRVTANDGKCCLSVSTSQCVFTVFTLSVSLCNKNFRVFPQYDKYSTNVLRTCLWKIHQSGIRNLQYRELRRTGKSLSENLQVISTINISKWIFNGLLDFYSNY